MLRRQERLDADKAVARWRAGLARRGLKERRTGGDPNNRNRANNWNSKMTSSFWNEEEIRHRVVKVNAWLTSRFGGT